MRWLLLSVGLTLLNGCTSVPPPCPCAQVMEELDLTSAVLAHALRDKGVLRQQLKACQENR